MLERVAQCELGNIYESESPKFKPHWVLSWVWRAIHVKLGSFVRFERAML